MNVEIRQYELRNNNALVMRRVAQGESFVVTVNGRPVADVIPHRRNTGRRPFVPVAELAALFASTPVEATGWQADLDHLDDLLGVDEPEDPFDEVGR